MKKSDIDYLVDYRCERKKTEEFASDIEERAGGVLSLSKGHGSLTEFFMKMAGVNRNDERITERRLNVGGCDFRIFNVDEHLGFFDHVDRFNLNGKPFMITSQPYQVYDEPASKMKDLCEIFGLDIFIGGKGSALRKPGGYLIIIAKKF